MTTPPRSRAGFHIGEAERILATLGSLGIADEDAVREAAAVVHALLAIAATLANDGPAPNQP